MSIKIKFIIGINLVIVGTILLVLAFFLPAPEYWFLNGIPLPHIYSLSEYCIICGFAIGMFGVILQISYLFNVVKAKRTSIPLF